MKKVVFYSTMIITLILLLSCSIFDTELKGKAILTAIEFDSDAFEGFDPLEPVKYYYFIPISSDQYFNIYYGIYYSSITNTGYAWDTDSGVVKARKAGYLANYGIVIHRKNREVEYFIATVYEKKNTY